MEIRLRYPHLPKTLARGAAAALLALCTACGGSPQKRADDAVASIRSWTSTLRLAGESWLQGKTPAHYTVSTLDQARQTLDGAVATLRESPFPPLRGELGRLGAPSAAAARMGEAVRRGDRAAVRAELARIGRMEAELAALQQRLAGKER